MSWPAAANLPPRPGKMQSQSSDLLYFFSGKEYVVYDPYREVRLVDGEAEELRKRSSRSPEGKEVIDYLLKHARRSRVDKVLANVGCTNAVIKTLVKNEVVEIIKVRL